MPSLRYPYIALLSLLAPLAHFACGSTSGDGPGPTPAPEAGPAMPDAGSPRDGSAAVGDGGTAPDANPDADGAPLCAVADATLAADPTFTPTSVHLPANSYLKLRLDPQGRVAVMGYTSLGIGASVATVTRVLPGGGLDVGFGSQGSVSVGTSNVLFDALGLDADGSILVGGFINGGGASRCAIERLTETGGVDTTIGPGAGAPPDASAPAGLFTFVLRPSDVGCTVSEVTGIPGGFAVGGATDSVSFAGRVDPTGTPAVALVQTGYQCGARVSSDGTLMAPCGSALMTVPVDPSHAVVVSETDLSVQVASSHDDGVFGAADALGQATLLRVSAAGGGDVAFGRPTPFGADSKIYDIAALCDGTWRVAAIVVVPAPDGGTTTSLAVARVDAHGATLGTSSAPLVAPSSSAAIFDAAGDHVYVVALTDGTAPTTYAVSRYALH